MGTYNCNPEYADKAAGLSPSTCHAQIYKIEEDHEKQSIKVYFDVLQSTDSANVQKSGSFTLFSSKADGSVSMSFHRNLRDITIAVDLATKEAFEQYKAAGKSVPIDPNDWVGMQLVIVLEPQKNNPQYTQPKTFLSVYDPKVSKQCLDEKLVAAIQNQMTQGLRPAMVYEHGEAGYMN